LYALAVVLAPNRISGGGLITDRLVLYPFFALILWFGAFVYRSLERRIIQAIAISFTLLLVAWHTVSYVRVNDYLAEFLSVRTHLNPGATMASLPFSSRIYAPNGELISFRVFPMNHASGFLALDRALVDLTNYEAA